MSNVDVFTIGLDQIHDLQKHGRILPFTDEVLWNSWLIVDCWASFGKSCGYVDTFTCLGVKHAFDLVAQLQDFNMGMIDRGVSGHGRHYEIWHVVDDSEVEWYLTTDADIVDDFDPEPVDWFGEMGDTLGEDLSECIEAYEYVRAIDEMF